MRKSLSALLLVLFLSPLAMADDAEVPPLKFVKRVLTVAEVTSLNSTPVTLLPPVTGFVYATEWALCLHTDRFATSPGNLQLRATGTNLFYAQFSGNGCLTSATVNGNAGAFAVLYGWGRLDDGGNSYGSKGVEIVNAVGNPTVDMTFPGSDVTIVLYYRLLPSYASNVP